MDTREVLNPRWIPEKYWIQDGCLESIESKMDVSVICSMLEFPASPTCYFTLNICKYNYSSREVIKIFMRKCEVGIKFAFSTTLLWSWNSWTEYILSAPQAPPSFLLLQPPPPFFFSRPPSPSPSFPRIIKGLCLALVYKK